MALWTDVIDPATLTGYARASLADYERTRGSLVQWLPNRQVADIAVRFMAGRAGLVDIARWRSYDAEPEIGRRPETRRVMIELPALGQNIPVSEYEQLRLRNAGTPDIALALGAIQQATDIVVRSVADTIERLRGIVITTGKATVAQNNFAFDDDFGRSASHTVTAGALWSTGSVSRIDYLNELQDVYADANGENPGVMLMSTRVFRALATGDEMQSQLLNTAVRPASNQQVQDTVLQQGLPSIQIYDRRVSVDGVSTRVIPDNVIIMLPASGSELGATFWGQTLTSTDPSFGIAAGEQPGLVAGVYRNPKPPMGIEVISDAIALPVLANADLSLVATVL